MKALWSIIWGWYWKRLIKWSKREGRDHWYRNITISEYACGFAASNFCIITIWSYITKILGDFFTNFNDKRGIPLLLCAEFSVILHLEKIFNFQANNIHIHNIIRKDMKPALILRTYTWLYYTIREFGPLTFNEINKMWKEEERLSEGNSMVRQTFARHRSDLEEILGVRISCDKRHRYYIKNDSLSYQNDRTILLNAAINQMLIKD